MSTGETMTIAIPQARKLLADAGGKLSELPPEIQELLDASAMEACRPSSRAMMVREENGESLGFGQLTRIKTPTGGGRVWQWEELGKVVTAEAISGALVVWRPRAILWPTEGDAVEGTEPILISDDLIHAYKNPRFDGEWGDVDEDLIEEARLPDSPYYAMQKLHYAQFGTAAKGEGKRMKEMRIAGVLPPGAIYPYIVNIGPGSVNDARTTLAKFPHFHYQTLVSLTLAPEKSSTGVNYSKVCLAVDGVLTDLEAAILKLKYTTPLHAAINEVGNKIAAGLA